jgi:hypothetical protein
VSILLAATVAAAAFLSGETLDYDLKWLRITGGSARMTIAPLDENRIRITSVGKSSPGFSRIFKVRDEIETIVARNDFSTLRYTKSLDEEGEKKVEVTTVEDGVATRRRKKVKSVRVPRPVFDPISLIYHLRTLDLTVGRTHQFSVVADAKVHTVHAVVVRKETLTTPAGRFNCLVVEPRMESGGVDREERMWIWYSDDERRLPVRIRTEVNFGAVTATLRGVSSAVGSIEPPAATEAR